MSELSLQRLLQYAQKVASLTNATDILAEACREVCVLTGVKEVFASCCLPNVPWERGVHLVWNPGGAHEAEQRARSALFAIHRKVVMHKGLALELTRSEETRPLFDGLRVEPGVTHLYVAPIVHRTGRIWGELVLANDRSLEGRVPGVAELAQHSTVALESAQRLSFARRDQDRLMLLSEASDDAVYEWDIDTRNFWWGGGIHKLIQSANESIETSTRWKLERIHPDDRERVEQSFSAALAASASSWQAEYRFRRHDGTYADVEDRGYFLRNVDGRAYRLIGSMRDVTAMRSLLAREQQARAEAERANRAKDEFLAMLGHELRNPLAPIVTGLELLSMRTPEAHREINIVQRQAHHLIRLVDDLLDISRIAHGKIELKKERLDAAKAIAAAIEIVNPLVQQRRHRLHVDVPRSGLELIADRARFTQVLANLLTNAAKYTEPGGDIFVTARHAGDAIDIEVRDNGVGIAPEMLPNIFNMFVQEVQSLARSQGGLGLGLAIVKSLVDLHGGNVSATSTVGLGSTFKVTMPAGIPAVARPDQLALRGQRPLSARRVVVVDDNVDAAELLSMLLEMLGNTTRIAHDAKEGLQLIDEFSPELAVLDIGLPEIDGYELARRVRQLPQHENVRLIAITGYGQASDKARATLAGFDAHLVKPVALDALEAVIEKLCAPSAELAQYKIVP